MRTPITYYGGKQRLAKRILQINEYENIISPNQTQMAEYDS